MFYDYELGYEIYVTSGTVGATPGFRNVYMGMTRNTETGSGHLFVLNGYQWVTVGELTFSGDSEPLSGYRAEPLSAGTLNAFLRGNFSHQFSVPISELREYAAQWHQGLIHLQRNVWNSIRRPSIGEFVFLVEMPNGEERLLTQREMLERFGQEAANTALTFAASQLVGGNYAPLAFSDDDLFEPMLAFEGLIIVVCIALGTVIIINAIFWQSNSQGIHMHNDFSPNLPRINFDPSLVWDAFSEIFTATQQFTFSRRTLDPVVIVETTPALSLELSREISTTITADVSTNLRENQNNRNTPGYTIYIVRRENRFGRFPLVASDVVYVGHTNRNLDTRQMEHRRHPERGFWRLEPVYVGIPNPIRARVLEQALIANFAFLAVLEDRDPLENQRRSVSQRNLGIDPYEAALRYIAIQFGIDQDKLLEFMRRGPLDPFGF